MIDLQGFRLNVAIVLVNHKNQVLLAKRVNQNAWQLPQGGVHDDEDLQTALYRELREEVGLDSSDVSFIANTKNLLRYKLPTKLRRKSDVTFIGQKQKWFLLKFIGEEGKIRFDLGHKPEFDDYQWVSYWYPLRKVIDFKKQVYTRALRELVHYIYNNKKYSYLDHICY